MSAIGAGYELTRVKQELTCVHHDSGRARRGVNMSTTQFDMRVIPVNISLIRVDLS